MKSILLAFICAFSLSGYSQKNQAIDSFWNKYNQTMDIYKRQMDDVNEIHNSTINIYNKIRDNKIKKLPITNYLSNKAKIYTKYNNLIDSINEAYNKEIDQIKYLENQLDVKRDEFFSELNEQQERAKEEEERRESELRRVEEQKQIKQQEFETSNYGRLQKEVKSKFEEWLLKGSFESQSDYENRIKTQTETQYRSILSEQVNNEISSILNRYCYVQLGKYNPENEICPLYSYSSSLIHDNGKAINEIDMQFVINLKVSKQIAPRFYTIFQQPGEIYVYPTKIAMKNNYWQIVECIVVLNNFWESNPTYGRGGALDARNVYEKNGKYFYDRIDQIGFNNGKKLKRHEMEDFNAIQNLAIIPKKVFYAAISVADPSVTQSLNFTYTDLGIKIPQY